MAFKIYFNKKTRHPSISLSGKDKEKWENLEMTHNPSGDNKYIDIVCITPKGPSKSYVRKYVRKDRHRVKGKLHKNTKLDYNSESKVKNYLKEHNKKDDGNPIIGLIIHLRTSHHLKYL